LRDRNKTLQAQRRADQCPISRVFIRKFQPRTHHQAGNHDLFYLHFVSLKLGRGAVPQQTRYGQTRRLMLSALKSGDSPPPAGYDAAKRHQSVKGSLNLWSTSRHSWRVGRDF
jgi:hypothetical protein